MSLMRNKSAELGIEADVSDKDLQDKLDWAERKSSSGRAYAKGDKLQAVESVFLVDGLVKLGESNVVIGQPKVGKSSFSTGLIAAIRERRSQFLGRDLLLPNASMPVLIFGTDQSEGDWLHLLNREQLVAEDRSVEIEFFASMETGDEFNFTKDGIRHMKEIIDEYQCPLVIIDSLSSMMEPTGIEENSSRFAQPIRNAINRLRETGATLIIIHHSVKRPTTWDWIAECRGSSSISSVFSWGVLMRWVAQEDDGLARTDFRVGFTGKGRGSNSSGGVMGQYMEQGGWTLLGGLEHAQRVERVGQRVMELSGNRALIYDYLCQRADYGVNDCGVDEIATEVNKLCSNINRELRSLRSKGLAQVVRAQETGGRPRQFWGLTSAAMEWSLRDSGGGFNDSSDSFTKQVNKINVINSQDSSTVLLSAIKESTPQPNESSPYLPPKTPVQCLVNEQWADGWLIRDATNPHNVTVEKLGSPSIVKTSLRWNLDIRPCPPTTQPQPNPLSLNSNLPF